ncbi:hypothetical protein A4G20_00135 [Pasteurellaceae bacterium RH1A]|nr:hypothetical protein A4G20_00135 [Pasteurellaceae bacterium RH1A]
MKLLNLATALALSGFIAAAPSYANTAKEPTKQAQKQKQTQKQTQKQAPKKMQKSPQKPAQKTTQAQKPKTTAKPAAKPAKKQAAKPAAKPVAKAAAAGAGLAAVAATASQLQENLSVKYLGQGVKAVEDQAVIFSNYEVKNLSDKDLQTMEWEVIYMVNGQDAHTKPIKLNVQAPFFKPGNQFNIEVQLGLNELSEENRQLFLSENSNITSRIQTKALTFSDQSKLTLK